MKYTHKIDFQAHYLPKSYYAFLEEQGDPTPDGFPTPDWSIEDQFEDMECLGISYALLTLSSPSLYTPDEAKTLDYVKRIYDEGSQIAKDYPDRLGFLGTMPLPYVEASVEEAKRCLDLLGAKGIGLMTNYGGTYLGDEKLDPLMEVLNDRAALVIMHPTEPAYVIPNVCQGLPIPAMEYFFETTRTFTNMVMKDTFAKYPKIKWVLPHAGAFLSILADRFESFALMLRFMDQDKRVDMMADLSHVYFDVAGFAEQKQVEMLLRNIDISHLVYGSDTPYTDIMACIGQTTALEESEKWTDEQKRLIFEENGKALLQ